MAVKFTLHQVTQVLDGPLFRVTHDVDAATEADTGVFVFSTATQKFDHFASPADVANYPVGYDAANALGAPFYRAAAMTRDWTTAPEMQADLAAAQARIAALARDLTALNGQLTIDQTVEIGGDDP